MKKWRFAPSWGQRLAGQPHGAMSGRLLLPAAVAAVTGYEDGKSPLPRRSRSHGELQH